MTSVWFDQECHVPYASDPKGGDFVNPARLPDAMTHTSSDLTLVVNSFGRKTSGLDPVQQTGWLRRFCTLSVLLRSSWSVTSWVAEG